jgi:hypothetical protein
MTLKPAIPCVAAIALLAAQAIHAGAQDVPRLDGSNVKQKSGWGAPNASPPKSATAAPATFGSAVAPAASEATADSAPADKPAQPATIRFQDGLLTVHAKNASLTQILEETASQTGMTLEGTPEDERVFGDFGPAPVTKVLAQLLDGGPSNYMVFGKKENLAPRSLVVSPKGSLAPGGRPPEARSTVVSSDDEDDDDDAPVAQVPLRPIPTPQQAEPNGPSPGIRTPQQILDEMERRRQEQPPQN